MDLQGLYDDLDTLIRNLGYAIDEIENKGYMRNYIDSLNEIKFEIENELEEVAEELEKEYKKEEIQQEKDYWMEAI